MTGKSGRLPSLLLTGLALILASPLLAPQLLAFPHVAQVGSDRVYSEQAIDRAELERVVDRANALAAASPLARADEGRPVFLTDGGWRWRWLSVSASGAFALTRPLSKAVILNRSDVAKDRIYNGSVLAGERTLSGVIAHEKCHGMIRGRYGIVRASTFAQELVEGYCDHIAQESTLSAAQVATFARDYPDHPALPYYHGRRKVEAALHANGGSVEALFEGW
ncbi:MAG: hypothetical protein KJZ64_14590 [Sphingomonadaceae bacterium]|nr:hypothetical protein [Sphingomonadaceae bacterium]